MKKINDMFSILCFLGIVLTLAGCNTEREVGSGERAILKAGQQVSSDMVGWVAVPNSSPTSVQDKATGITYLVLASHNIVPVTVDGSFAVPPTLFAKMTDITIEVPKIGSEEKWILKPEGKSVPKDKQGWIAVSPSEPQVERSSHLKGLEVATLSSNNIIPKEMNGWVAIDKETFAKLVEKFLMTGSGSKVSKD